jgi:hypothetical protein
MQVFDTRRGQREGDEGDKILAFHPSSLDLNAQKGIVGFAEATIMFSSTFSKVPPPSLCFQRPALLALTSDIQSGLPELTVWRRRG